MTSDCVDGCLLFLAGVRRHVAVDAACQHLLLLVVDAALDYGRADAEVGSRAARSGRDVPVPGRLRSNLVLLVCHLGGASQVLGQIARRVVLEGAGFGEGEGVVGVGHDRVGDGGGAALLVGRDASHLLPL